MSRCERKTIPVQEGRGGPKRVLQTILGEARVRGDVLTIRIANFLCRKKGSSTEKKKRRFRISSIRASLGSLPADMRSDCPRHDQSGR